MGNKKEASVRHYKKHGDEVRRKARESYYRNKEKRRKYQREYYRKNKEKYKEYQKQYHQNHKSPEDLRRTWGNQALERQQIDDAHTVHSLQALSPEKFGAAINMVLAGQHDFSGAMNRG